MQSVFYITGNPVGHGVFCSTAQEDTQDTQGKTKTGIRVPFGGCFAAGSMNIGNGGEEERQCGEQRKHGEEEGQVHPVFGAKNTEKQRTDQNNSDHAVTVQRMQGAHIPLRIIGRKCGNQGTQKHFTQTGRYGENNGTDNQSGVGVLGEQGRNQGVQCHTHGGQNGHEPYHDLNIEEFGEKGEHQINGQLGTEIDQNQGAQQCVGNSIGFPEGNEQHRRQGKNGCHGQIGEETGEFGAFIVPKLCGHNSTSFLRSASIISFVSENAISFR